jgi:hypothetical protein
MRERIIKDVLIGKLREIFRDWDILDYPLVLEEFITSSNFINPYGAILVKSLGFAPIYYLENQQINPFVVGDFIQINYRFLILIVAKDMSSENEMLETTKIVINGFQSMPILDNVGQVRIESVSEAEFDETTGLSSREIIISQLAFEYLGE